MYYNSIYIVGLAVYLLGGLISAKYWAVAIYEMHCRNYGVESAQKHARVEATTLSLFWPASAWVLVFYMCASRSLDRHLSAPLPLPSIPPPSQGPHR